MSCILNLIDISTINAGYSFRGKIPETSNSGVFIVQMKDINSAYGVTWDTLTQIQYNDSHNYSHDLQYGDILFAARGYKNYAVLIDNPIYSMRAIAAPQFFVIRLNTAMVLPEYLQWYLNQFIAQRYFSSYAEGSTTPSIRRTVLEAMPIILPTLKKQQTMISLVKTIHKEKDIAMKIIENADRLMYVLLNEMNHHYSNEEEDI